MHLFSTGIQENRSPDRKIRDYRAYTLLAILLLVAITGYFISVLPGRGVDALKKETDPAPAPAGFTGLAKSEARLRVDPAESAPLEQEMEIGSPAAEKAQETLKEARVLIRKRQWDGAIGLLNRSHDRLQEYPESYVVLGQALEGKGDFALARDFYNTAINRNRMLADAYWGYATASEGLGDVESALGGMRSFLHTEPNKDKNRLKIAQARSAIWEWESKLGRGAWGATKGIPPGFTANELKRDGKGVGIKMPIPGTEGPDGSFSSEVKSQDKFKLFKP